MSDALVTVLLPVKHYHPPFLARASGSVLAQTSAAWRLLVIATRPDADGLEDQLGEALADERVQLVENRRPGLSGALNTGLLHATTEFTAILHGDDLWSPDAIEVLSRAIAGAPEVDFFHTGRRFIDQDDRPISSDYRAPETFTLDDFVYKSPVKHLLCWRREAALAIGGLDETLNSVGPDDLDFPWSMAEAGYRFQAIPDCLYLHRDHRAAFRLTTHLPRSTHTHELRRILRKHGVGRLAAERVIAQARSDYLRQCLYRSRLDRWLKQRRGYDARAGWREPLR